MLSCGKS